MSDPAHTERGTTAHHRERKLGRRDDDAMADRAIRIGRTLAFVVLGTVLIPTVLATLYISSISATADRGDILAASNAQELKERGGQIAKMQTDVELIKVSIVNIQEAMIRQEEQAQADREKRQKSVDKLGDKLDKLFTPATVQRLRGD